MNARQNVGHVVNTAATGLGYATRGASGLGMMMADTGPDAQPYRPQQHQQAARQQQPHPGYDPTQPGPGPHSGQAAPAAAQDKPASKGQRAVLAALKPFEVADRIMSGIYNFSAIIAGKDTTPTPRRQATPPTRQQNVDEGMGMELGLNGIDQTSPHANPEFGAARPPTGGVTPGMMHQNPHGQQYGGQSR